MEQIRNFDQLLQAALAHGRKGIAVAAPDDRNTLLAVKDALASGLAAPQLFGDVERMLPLLEQVQLDAGAVKLTDVRDTAQAIDAAIESIRSGENQILMKGAVSTGTLLKHALDRTRGLNIGRLASHLIVLQIPGLDRLLISTDGGLNIAPTLMEKADILRNAIDVARALGIETPKAACLAAVETVNPKMQATVDAACLCKMADRGAFPGAVVEGPLAMDNILSAEAARKKGIDSPVPGHADIILAPSIEVANTFSKTLSPSIRISYMVLPPALMDRFRRELGFYGCTVASFEQYTLARFLDRGYFEKHINRMRKFYRARRNRVIALLESCPGAEKFTIQEQDAGLHFLLKVDTSLSDEALTQAFLTQGLKVQPLSAFYTQPWDLHSLVINYSGVDEENLEKALKGLVL